MAEERTLGLARAPEFGTEERSKEELQRRMEEARDSISQTVTEIKDNVAHQVEAVKDALDWREYVKKRPVAWSLGAAGVGFMTGYCIAATIKGDSRPEQYAQTAQTLDSHAARPLLARQVRGEHALEVERPATPTNGGDQHDGPGLLERFKETSAYERLSKEAGSLGDRFVDELSSVAQTVVLPALLSKVKNWIGLDLSAKSGQQPAGRLNAASSRPHPSDASYERVTDLPS